MIKLRAFTLIEVLVFAGMLIVVSSLAVVIATPQLLKQRSENTAKEIASAIASQQQTSYSGLSEKAYGVRFDTISYSTFMGASWETRESADTFELPTGTSIVSIDLTGGADEVVFASEGLLPSANGEILLLVGGSSYAVTINSQGLIDYESR